MAPVMLGTSNNRFYSSNWKTIQIYKPKGMKFKVIHKTSPVTIVMFYLLFVQNRMLCFVHTKIYAVFALKLFITRFYN